ncbi:hypothetical protein GUITHDRAFT_103922 [Guillardia theta CCMP2712]|uniref:Uncharacterized protein n=1 Tax=Guillardia theta (strain CCMP2712) TaxID=905079 RepID=L1JP97_GUITC|nr:hypothetical protein GUITHDRAFT_103922 [Guillardia theta CCMP2712]EKX50109.1 hypothetical protein GUITHDRAFT_103922 [Guillardia theta CCMP2712]|eukprot:XP_005837089.1 hypothetical protein GUITHDRAFT_103922 [Guillardia theta CCMP2712]
MSPSDPRQKSMRGDEDELNLLRSLLKNVPLSTDPSALSSVVGRYASFLSFTTDDRSAMADDFFKVATSLDNPCPRSVHTFHWHLCSRKHEYRSITQYEKVRARAPVHVEEMGQLVAEARSAKPQHSEEQRIEAMACLANFLDEICHAADLAEDLYDEVVQSKHFSPFIRGKYAAFLARNRPDQHEASLYHFRTSLETEPGNVECMLDFATFLSRSDVQTAERLFKDAMNKELRLYAAAPA